jgi:hypothetical protein
MNISERISAFARLGEAMKNLPPETSSDLFQRATNENAWFTRESVDEAWSGIQYLLDANKLEKLMQRYPVSTTPKTVGVIMAGNIPLVGFHDFMCVLLAGHRIWMKPSSSDSVLILFVAELLKQLQPAFAERIHVVDRINGVEAAIATGSNNTARYFEYYFRSIPHVIRKNRTSCAVLLGGESESDYLDLGQDVFTYYGLGCRNVSSLFVPKGFSFTPLLDAWQKFAPVAHHHKYANNLDYQKAILLVNGISFLDGGHVLLTESAQLVSPISVVHYRTYESAAALDAMLHEVSDSIQVIVSRGGRFKNSKPFGVAQRPEPDDYADGLDTLAFLTSI